MTGGTVRLIEYDNANPGTIPDDWPRVIVLENGGKRPEYLGCSMRISGGGYRVQNPSPRLAPIVNGMMSVDSLDSLVEWISYAIQSIEDWFERGGREKIESVLQEMDSLAILGRLYRFQISESQNNQNNLCLDVMNNGNTTGISISIVTGFARLIVEDEDPLNWEPRLLATISEELATRLYRDLGGGRK